MPSVTIRGLDEEVLQRVRTRARNHGRSMEAELRLIIEEAGMSRDDVLLEIDELNSQSRPTSSDEVDSWIRATRDRPV